MGLFKRGDKVKVVESDVLENIIKERIEYGDYGFIRVFGTRQVEELCGKEVTIERVLCSEDTYLIISSDEYCYIHESLLEPIIYKNKF